MSAVVETAVAPPPRIARQRLRRLGHDPRFVVGALLLGAFALMAAAPGLVSPHDPTDCDLALSTLAPSGTHPFGYDVLGCDLLAKSVHGARTSLIIGLTVVASALVVAIVLGSLAGWFRGAIDVAVSRLADIWFGVPVVLGGLVFLSFFDQRGVGTVIAVLTLFGWPAMTRLMRATVIREATAEYVQAARVLGAGELRMLFRHVVPNSLTPVLVYAAVYTGIAIAAEATLSFLGVGLQLPDLSWGTMIGGARERIAADPHLLLPGLFLVGTVLGFVLLGEALRAATDPRQVDLG